MRNANAHLSIGAIGQSRFGSTVAAHFIAVRDVSGSIFVSVCV